MIQSVAFLFLISQMSHACIKCTTLPYLHYIVLLCSLHVLEMSPNHFLAASVLPGAMLRTVFSVYILLYCWLYRTVLYCTALTRSSVADSLRWLDSSSGHSMVFTFDVSLFSPSFLAGNAVSAKIINDCLFETFKKLQVRLISYVISKVYQLDFKVYLIIHILNIL